MPDDPEQSHAEQRARQERDQAEEQMARYLGALEHWFARRPFRCASCGGDSWWFLGWETTAAGNNNLYLSDRFVPDRALLGHLIYDLGTLYCTDCYTVATVQLNGIVEAVSRPPDGQGTHLASVA